MRYQLSKRLAHRCLSLPHRTSTQSSASLSSYLPLLARYFSYSLSPSLSVSHFSPSSILLISQAALSATSRYMWMRIIQYTPTSARAHVYTRVRLPCGVLGPRGRTAVPATLSHPRPLHMPLHTHIMDRLFVPLLPVAALSSSSLARFVSLTRAVAVYTSGTSVGRRYTALAGAAASWTRSPLTSPLPPAPVCYTDNIFRKHVG